MTYKHQRQNTGLTGIATAIGLAALSTSFAGAQEAPTPEERKITEATIVHRPPPRWKIMAANTPARIDFNGTGPHYIDITTGARSTTTGHCQTTVVLIDRDDHERHTLWDAMDYEPRRDEGETYSYTRDNVDYDFHINYCNNRTRNWDRHTSITVTRDLSDYEEPDFTLDNSFNRVIDIHFEKVGEPYRKIIEDKIRLVGPGQQRVSVYNVAESYTMAFEEAKTLGNETTGTASAVVVSGSTSVQYSESGSAEIQFEQETQRGMEIGFNGDLCTHWRVQIYQDLQKLQISSPRFSNEEVIADFVLDADIRVTPDPNLCPDLDSLPVIENGPIPG